MFNVVGVKHYWQSKSASAATSHWDADATSEQTRPKRFCHAIVQDKAARMGHTQHRTDNANTHVLEKTLEKVLAQMRQQGNSEKESRVNDRFIAARLKTTAMDATYETHLFG